MESPSPFDSLPDEVVIKVLKMAVAMEMECHKKHKKHKKHNFLVDTIARTSSRFERLSQDKSLWRLQVVIDGHEL